MLTKGEVYRQLWCPSPHRLCQVAAAKVDRHAYKADKLHRTMRQSVHELSVSSKHGPDNTSSC